MTEDDDTDITETPPASLPPVLPAPSEITDAVLERLLDSPPATVLFHTFIHFLFEYLKGFITTLNHILF